ncbi:MAG: glycosyltransferase family 2 protein [Nanoarchaeota archaeon]
MMILFLSIFIHKKVKKKDIEPNVTFLITAYNEEKNIKEKLENVLSLDYPRDKLEIIVASDSSNDQTDSIVNNFLPKGVKLFRVEGRKGKTEVQNKAVEASCGEIIVFSDATTLYEKSAIRKIVRNYSDPFVGAVSGRYQYYDPNKTQVGAGTVSFWDYENFIKVKQSGIFTITGCCGCIYSVKRKLYTPLPRDIISDLVEPLTIIEKGYRIIFESEALAYETTCETFKEEFKMRVRVITRGMRGLLHMKTLLNPFKHAFVSFQLLSHKVLRWLIPIFLIILYISNFNLIEKNTFFFAFFFLQTSFYLVALLSFFLDFLKIRIKIFSLPLYFCLINLASISALIRIIFQEKDITWETIRK